MSRIINYILDMLIGKEDDIVEVGQYETYPPSPRTHPKMVAKLASPTYTCNICGNGTCNCNFQSIRANHKDFESAKRAFNDRWVRDR